MASDVKNKIIELLATGFYIGKLPKAPGTFGTLVGVPIAWLLMQLPIVAYMLICVVLIFLAIWVAELYERMKGGHDMGEIVIDEIVGYVITMTWLPISWQSFVAGFIVFRFFDIVKPPPISKLDERVKGGFGTILDDVAAGLASNVVLQIVYANTALLGVQLHAS